MTHSLSVGHSLQSGSFSDVTELTYLRYGAQWRLFRQTSLGASISYEQFTENAGSGESGSRYGFNLNLSRPWTRHWSSTLGYQVYLKNSDTPNQDYVQNRLVLDLIYSF